jgi:sigma-B regulation protein RsbU (phosphoserine phosphatase)
VIYSEASEKKRIDLDLQVAQEIQRILLPAAAPEMQSFDISGINIPARQVSGDYYGYIPVAPDKWGVVVADVSGKGIPASLIMAMCRSVLRSRAAENSSPADVLRKVNRELYPDIKEDMFISMAYMLLDDKSPAVTLCRAGHDAPLLYSAKEQTVTQLNPPGMALGIDSGDVFDRITGDFSVTLEPDDCLILYTDGVTEALDAKGMEFGLKKMIQSIQFSAGDGAAGIIKRITDDIQNFIGTYPQYDDITLIAIRRK